LIVEGIPLSGGDRFILMDLKEQAPELGRIVANQAVLIKQISSDNVEAMESVGALY
jgi:hypothetical protein